MSLELAIVVAAINGDRLSPQIISIGLVLKTLKGVLRAQITTEKFGWLQSNLIRNPRYIRIAVARSN